MPLAVSNIPMRMQVPTFSASPGAETGADVVDTKTASTDQDIHDPSAKSGVSELFSTLSNPFSDAINGVRKTFSRFVHDRLPPQNPRVKDHVPDTAYVTEKKPTGDELRSAELNNKQGEADLEAAERYAQEAFERLDLSDPNKDIAIWVPATEAHETPEAAVNAIKKQFGNRVTATHLDYPATANFGPSTATGMEALRLLLAKIADKGGNHRVMLSGHSQGSWVIADAMSDPVIHRAVDRSIIFGNPGPANTHYTNRKDSKMIELNDPNDPVTWPFVEKQAFLDGMVKWEKGDKLGAARSMVKTLSPTNFTVAMYYLAQAADKAPWNESDPHHYEKQFSAGFEWLDTGKVK